MDNSTFDKLFADKMRGAGAPDFSDEDWGRLSPLLESEQKRRWRAFPLWWLGALSGLLLCSNLGWWWMWRQSEKKTETIRQEWQQVRQDMAVKHDTVWSKEIVYQYDTIYRTIVYRGRSMGTSRGGDYGSRQDASGRFESGKFAVPAPNANTSGTSIQRLTDLQTGATNSAVTSSNPDMQPQSPISLQRLPLPPAYLKIPARAVETPQKDLVFIPIKHSQSKGNALLMPKEFRIGAGGGFFIPSAPSFTQNIGFTTALMGELAFSERLALTLEGAYAGVSFQGTQFDARLGLPSDASPGDDYTLKYFNPEEGVVPLLQLSLGMRYWIKSSHRLSPYLGLGYAMQWQLPYELQLEYTHKLTGDEKEVTRELSFQGTPASYLDLNAGIRYRFLRHFSLQTGATYQYKLDASQAGIPKFWGVKSAVMYSF